MYEIDKILVTLLMYTTWNDHAISTILGKNHISEISHYTGQITFSLIFEAAKMMKTYLYVILKYYNGIK